MTAFLVCLYILVGIFVIVLDLVFKGRRRALYLSDLLVGIIIIPFWPLKILVSAIDKGDTIRITKGPHG